MITLSVEIPEQLFTEMKAYILPHMSIGQDELVQEALRQYLEVQNEQSISDNK